MPHYIDMKKSAFKLIALLTAIPGIYYLLHDHRAYYWVFEELFSGHIPSAKMPVWATIASVLIVLINLLRPIAGYGLFKLRTWGHRLATGVLSIDFLERMAGFIYTWTYYHRHPEALQAFEDLQKTFAGAQQSGADVHVGMTSMIPSYVIALIGLMSLIFLMQYRPEDN